VTVVGPPGIGKTALAVRWAHQHQASFPDGHLYVDLQGFGPHPPSDPAEVLGGFLRSLGVAGRHIPASLTERAASFRSMVDGRRMLVFLDNASTEEQVRLLLPGSDSCQVLVTSRENLAGLVVHHDAEVLHLDVLEPSDALSLFRRLVGTRAKDEPHQATTLVGFCAGLPLTLRIVAQLAVSRRDAPLSNLVRELEAERDALDILDAGDDSRSTVRTVLSWSYHRLPSDVGRVFRLLGAHPGLELDVDAFAALTGSARKVASRLLRRLASAHLVTEFRPARYRIHDLLRVYVTELCSEPDGAEEAAAARIRLFDFHLHTADRADRWITPNRYRIPLDGVSTEGLEFGSYDSALSWLNAELGTMVALCRVDRSELDSRRWQLAFTMRGYFFLSKHWGAWIETHRCAFAATRRAGDTHAEARIRNDLGRALLESGQSEEAATHYDVARHIFESLGDRHGASNATANQAVLLRRQGNLTEALRLNGIALAYYIEAGARRNTAIALRSRARMELEAGDSEQAVRNAEKALDIFRGLSLSVDMAETYNVLGVARATTADWQGAEQAHLFALESSRQCGSTYEAAESLRHLGSLAARAHDTSSANRCWRAALELYSSLGARQAVEVVEALRGLKPE
jgi:tetratricopeptide (TPR) repeat protein